MSRILSLTLVVALVLAACSNGDGSDTTGAVDPDVTSTAGGADPTDPDATTTTTQPSPPIIEPDLSGIEGLSEAALAQLEALIREAQEIRELPFLSPPKITVVTPEELEARVRADIEEQADELPADDALYKLLGLLPAESDLETILTDLYGDQVAGFYDGEVGEIVVPMSSTGFSVVEQATLVHELVHALTDQHFLFDPVRRDMIDGDRFDEVGGFTALVEGDAVLAEVMWLRTLSPSELGQFVDESLAIDTSSLDAAPLFIRDSLLFPYDSGLAFAQELYAIDGWATVNEAYEIFPGLPPSTEQVITPDDYRRDLPIEVDLPSVDLTGYELAVTSVWGEEGFRTMLSQVVGDSNASKAADGWGGDSYYQWFDGENAALLLIYQADTERDLEELRSALLDYARTAVPDEDFVWVDEEDGLVYFIAADDPEVGAFLRSEMGLES